MTERAPSVLPAFETARRESVGGSTAQAVQVLAFSWTGAGSPGGSLVILGLGWEDIFLNMLVN